MKSVRSFTASSQLATLSLHDGQAKSVVASAPFSAGEGFYIITPLEKISERTFSPTAYLMRHPSLAQDDAKMMCGNDPTDSDAIRRFLGAFWAFFATVFAYKSRLVKFLVENVMKNN